MNELILASSSPRRKELLENLPLKIKVHPSYAEEIFDSSWSPEKIVQELARMKAIDVSKNFPNDYVLGADTIVVFDGEILGKPSSRENARFMLQKLSGQIHQVFTGVAIISSEQQTIFYEKTEVAFWELTNEEIEFYLDSGEPFDKAGAYGIQGLGATLVKEIHGDFFTVVGLPVSRTIRELRKFGF